LLDRIEPAFEAEREKIRRLAPRAEILHTGGTAVPEALTRGDLDIHVRVPGGDFPAVRDALGLVYAAYRAFFRPSRAPKTTTRAVAAVRRAPRRAASSSPRTRARSQRGRAGGSGSR